ncbi:UNVERIFIED_CONTAM: hypothetical protein FKN15_047896 [Acipenser sinensis]
MTDILLLGALTDREGDLPPRIIAPRHYVHRGTEAPSTEHHVHEFTEYCAHRLHRGTEALCALRHRKQMCLATIRALIYVTARTRE